jgi:hypothetical protein
VREAPDPETLILDFYGSTYDVGATGGCTQSDPWEPLRKAVHGPPARKERLSKERFSQCRTADASCGADF